METDQTGMDVPESWKRVEERQLRGLTMIVGGTDAGKTTFASYIYGRLDNAALPPCYLDGDPGQSTIGPPCTMSLAMGRAGTGGEGFPPAGDTKHFFIGSTSPAGHMLQCLVACAALVGYARAHRRDLILYDTSGLIDRDRGGHHLKWSEIRLLKPGTVVAVGRGRDIESLLAPLRRLPGLTLIEIETSPLSRVRSVETRKNNRRNRYRDYFDEAEEIRPAWRDFALFPGPEFQKHRLLAFEGPDGLVEALGILLEGRREDRRLRVLTPLRSLERARVIRLGDVRVDPDTWEDTWTPN